MKSYKFRGSCALCDYLEGVYIYDGSDLHKGFNEAYNQP